MLEVRLIVLIFVCVLTGCGDVQQPESVRIVAAFEVPLPTEDDRNEFMSVLRVAAEPEGMHVDAASAQKLKNSAAAIPEAKMTIHAAVWLGEDEVIASILDIGRPGHARIIFSEGEDPEKSRRFQNRVMQEICSRWPETLSLPVMPTGTIPHRKDLIRRPDRYIVDPMAEPKYSVD